MRPTALPMKGKQRHPKRKGGAGQTAPRTRSKEESSATKKNEAGKAAPLQKRRGEQQQTPQQGRFASRAKFVICFLRARQCFVISCPQSAIGIQEAEDLVPRQQYPPEILPEQVVLRNQAARRSCPRALPNSRSLASRDLQVSVNSFEVLLVSSCSIPLPMS